MDYSKNYHRILKQNMIDMYMYIDIHLRFWDMPWRDLHVYWYPYINLKP